MFKEKKNDPSQLTSHLGFWMRLVSNHVSFSFARKLDSAQITVAEWVILREMYGSQNQTSPSAVAELTGLTRGAVSKLISRLLEKGLVNRREASGDRRYQDIELTKKGKSIVPQLASLADENDEEFFSILTSHERKQMKNLLQKIAKNHELRVLPTE